jgi:hypothetical protein
MKMAMLVVLVVVLPCRFLSAQTLAEEEVLQPERGKTHEKPFDRVVQLTDALIKRAGHWQAAASQVSSLER